MLLVAEEDDDVEEDCPTGDDEAHPPVEISLCSVIDISKPKTMKLKGVVNGKEVVIMVDPGATHNFLSSAMVAEAQIPVTEGNEFGVSLGNGEVIQGRGVCRRVRVELGVGVTIVDDFLPLGLGNADIILGVQWLSRLGCVTTNWKTHVMSFKVGGREVVLRGDPNLESSHISLKAMIRTISKQQGGIWVEINKMEERDGELGGERPPEFLKEVLELSTLFLKCPVGCRRKGDTCTQ